VDTNTEQALSERQNVVAFRLDKQTYALPIEPIVQIIDMVAITSIPQLSQVVEGVINVHGEAVAVVKLRRHFGLSDAPLRLNTPILLTQIGGQTIGLIVDEVTDVLHLSADQVVQLADILPEELGDAPIFRGLAYVSDDAVLMLDHESLFQPDQLQALAQAADMLQEAIAKKAAEESSAATKAKPVRRRRKATPRKKDVPEKPPAESKPKPTRKRRRKSKSDNLPES
jgi:purine-binding chemotaxis protein CheW